MSITFLTGLPGTGKSRQLINLVNAAGDQGRLAKTFVCSAYPWPSNHGAFWNGRRLVCGEPGLTCPLDHFVSNTEASRLLALFPAGSLAAVEEGYAFGESAVDDWLAASERGVEVVVAAPSGQQLARTPEGRRQIVALTVICRRCGLDDAAEVVVLADGVAMSVCANCFSALKEEAREVILRSLVDEQPFPGEKGLYQPVELPGFETWRLARWDSLARATAMDRVVNEYLGARKAPANSLYYLDVGCNTGLFCDFMARRGFRAKGVDATERFVTSSRLLETFFRRKTRERQEWVLYERANAYEYLRDTQDERFDVTSAFAVFQWVMIQRSVEHGLQCIEWLSSKTKGLCFIEMGYSAEEMYHEALPVEINREWVVAHLRERGDFSDVHVIDARPHGLQRDLFVGVKAGANGRRALGARSVPPVESRP